MGTKPVMRDKTIQTTRKPSLSLHLHRILQHYEQENVSHWGEKILKSRPVDPYCLSHRRSQPTAPWSEPICIPSVRLKPSVPTLRLGLR